MNLAKLWLPLIGMVFWVGPITVTVLGDVQPETATSAEVTGPLKTIAEVRELTLEEVILQRDVLIEGVVCTRDRFQGSFFLHDGEHPIYVAYPNAGSLSIGDTVRVRGHVDSGHVNHILVASGVEELTEQRALPTPSRFSASKLSLPKHDCEWVRLDDAVVEVAIVRADSTTLYCTQDDVQFVIGINGTLPRDRMVDLAGAQVSATGNCGVYWDGPKVRSLAIFTDASRLKVTQPATKPLKVIPYTKIARSWDSDEFRTKGKLTYFDHFGMFVEDETGGTWFQFPRELYHLDPGSTIEVFGHCIDADGDKVLAARLLHVQRTEPLRKLSPTNIDEVSAEYESSRVCLEGALVDYEVEFCEEANCEITRLLLENGSKRFSVEVHAVAAKQNSFNLSTAKFVSATGPISFSKSVEGCSLRMFAQSFSDIEVSERRPVWGLNRVAILMAIGGVGLVCCLVWGMRHRITNLRRGKELQGLSAQLRSSYDSIRDAIIIVDDKQNILAANRKAKEFFNFDFELGQLKPASSIGFKETHGQQEFGKTWHDLNQDFTSTIEAELEISDPQLRTLEAFTAPVDNAGHASTARLWAFYDVTERQRMHDNLCHSQKQEAIGRLAGGLAHDFNNLLTGISGNLFVSKVDETKTVREVRENLDAAEGAAHRAGELVSNLLGFSKKLRLNKRPICANAILQRMEPLLGPSIPKSIRLEFELADSLPRVFADPVQLEQVLLNICLNARDSIMQNESGSGTIVVTTSSKRMPCQGEQSLQIAIRDDGCGISRELLPHIFEPFFTTKGNKGTGLGLSMSLGIIEQHQGKIEIESQYGKGTTFVISVPAPLPPDSNAARVSPTHEDANELSDQADEQTQRHQLAGKRVIVIDDEVSICNLLANVLATERMIVITANNGEEAIRLLSHRADIDLAILDWKMPVLGGRETLHWLKQHRPDLTVIACSGHAFEMEQDLKGGDCTPDFVLQKPFGVQSLIGAIRDSLREKLPSPDTMRHLQPRNKEAINSSLHR